jgi:hypothetical protein
LRLQVFESCLPKEPKPQQKTITHTSLLTRFHFWDFFIFYMQAYVSTHSLSHLSAMYICAYSTNSELLEAQDRDLLQSFARSSTKQSSLRQEGRGILGLGSASPLALPLVLTLSSNNNNNNSNNNAPQSTGGTVNCGTPDGDLMTNG